MAQLRSRDLVVERLPDLCLGLTKTSHSAIKPKPIFVGTLNYWMGFEAAVWQAFRNHRWNAHTHILSHTLQVPSPAHLSVASCVRRRNRCPGKIPAECWAGNEWNIYLTKYQSSVFRFLSNRARKSDREGPGYTSSMLGENGGSTFCWRAKDPLGWSSPAGY